METFDDLEYQLRAALRPGRLPESSDTWNRIEWRLMRIPPRTTHRSLIFALTALVLLIATTSVVLATSTAAQEQLRVLSGLRVSNNRLDGLSPGTPLAIFQPSYLPSGMVLITTAYNSGSAGGGPPQPSVNSTVSRVGGKDIAPDVVATATRRGNILLSSVSGPIVVLIYADETKRYIEITQQSAGGKSLPKGDTIMLRQLPGTHFHDDGREVIAWAEQGTLIQIATTVARPDAIRVAESLRQTPLTTASPTIGEAPPAWVTVPLARRVQTVRKITVDVNEAVQRCGTWDPSNHSSP